MAFLLEHITPFNINDIPIVQPEDNDTLNINKIPQKHPLRDVLYTHFIINSDSSFVNEREIIEETLVNLSIYWEQLKNSVYNCSYLSNCEILKFKISISRNDDIEHIVEFKQLSGDRFAYASLLAMLEQNMGPKLGGITIPGARTFRVFDEVDLSNSGQQAEFLSELISEKSPPQLRLDGLVQFNACIEDILKCDKKYMHMSEEEKQNTPNIFNICPIYNDMIKIVIGMIKDISYYEKLPSISILTHMYELEFLKPNISEEVLSDVDDIINYLIKQELDYHLHRLVLSLCLSIIKSGNKLSSEIFEKVNNDLKMKKFDNDIPAKKIAEELLCYC